MSSPFRPKRTSRGSKKIAGTPFYRLRQGDWRIPYRVVAEERRIVVVSIARRNERTYNGLH